jgi:hypothetical protein
MLKRQQNKEREMMFIDFLWHANDDQETPPPRLLFWSLCREYVLCFSGYRVGYIELRHRQGIQDILCLFVLRTVASVLYTLSLQGPWYGNFSRLLPCQHSFLEYHLMYCNTDTQCSYYTWLTQRQDDPV